MLHTFRWSRFTAVIARTVIVAVVVMAAAVVSLLLVDRVNPPAAVVDPGIATVDTSKHSRLLILHVDSWRYETALDSTLMPNVARLRHEGASWELQTVFEGFTIPAVRAAFSGRAETQLVSLIQNFSFHALPIGSFYLDASRLGKKTLVVAHDPWVQFGPYFEERLPTPHGEDRITLDHERPAIALNAFRSEKFDIVVCHYESADWVAHEDGIHSERYRREFAYADSLIAAFADARQPNDYLLIYGDHGHSETGEHKTGISIPTYGMLFGPDVKAGVTADALAMTNIRYIASHAIGITLRSAPYDTRTIAEFLPIVADSAVANGQAVRQVSRAPGDYALTLVVALAALLLCWGLVGITGGSGVTPTTITIFLVAFGAELLLQMKVAPTITLFPLLLIGLGVAAHRQSWFVRLVIVAIGIWFTTRAVGWGFSATNAISEPTELRALVPLYAFAIAAKFLVLFGASIIVPGEKAKVSEWRTTSWCTATWPHALAWTAVLSLLEFRVWDHPAACAIVFTAGITASLFSTSAANRRMAQIGALQALIYFTLRLPLYQLAWIDLFFASLWLIARSRDDAWVDTLIITGSFALTCGWLATSLEWGFLYALFPADTIEKHVQYFVPFILAKIPLLLVLAFVVINRVPTRRAVTLVFAYTAIRFAAAWVLRLSGASGANLWPLAEQGIYLATFVVAVVAWAWTARKFPLQQARAA